VIIKKIITLLVKAHFVKECQFVFVIKANKFGVTVFLLWCYSGFPYGQGCCNLLL